MPITHSLIPRRLIGPTRMIRKSLTLVPVGPGDEQAAQGGEPGPALLLVDQAPLLPPRPRLPTKKAPAAPLVPSIPSLSAARPTDVGPVGERRRGGERIFEVRPAAARAEDGDGQLAARDQRAAGRQLQARFRHGRGPTSPRFARALAEQDGPPAEPLRLGRGGGEQVTGAGDHAEFAGHLLRGLGQRRLQRP